MPMLRNLTLTSRASAWLLVCGLSLSSWAQAQDQRPAPQVQRLPDQNVQVGLSPELTKILETWEIQSAKVTRSKGEFKRIMYDQAFQVAKCSTGKYWFEGPDKGRMDFAPNKDVEGQKLKRADVEYVCQPDELRSWICNGEVIRDIDIAKKEYHQIQIPTQFQGQNISDGPLPFLFGMNSKKMQQRYLLELGSLHDPKKLIHIVAYPKMPAEQREYRVAEVLLNPETYLPQAVQLMDPTGNKQTVYMFTKHDKVIGPWLPTAPWNPALISYTRILDQQSDASPQQNARENSIILR
ncbi:hypothetical protein SH668x_003748 [Planctomicrobium sp. SH668]|uniref:hypothetical protein n=1 Tax=Planctomicrobium sp. SH668 TaxID=3448126 RepID=UPI003F5C3690